MKLAITTLLSVLIISTLVAGCGGSSKSDDSSGGSGGKSSASDKPDVANGKSIFKDKCGSCHSLADAKTDGTFGPDLDTLKPTKDEVAKMTEKGGGGMPAELVTGAEARDVAAYVSSAAG